jgi:hypothetical protein
VETLVLKRSSRFILKHAMLALALFQNWVCVLWSETHSAMLKSRVVLTVALPTIIANGVRMDLCHLVDAFNGRVLIGGGVRIDVASTIA